LPGHRHGEVHAAHLRAVLLRTRLGGLGRHHGRVHPVHRAGHDLLPDRPAPDGGRPGGRGGEGGSQDEPADPALAPLAGVTLFGQNISTPDRVSALTASLRVAAAGDDPVIAIDEEGGGVTRVAYSAGSPY